MKGFTLFILIAITFIQYLGVSFWGQILIMLLLVVWTINKKWRIHRFSTNDKIFFLVLCIMSFFKILSIDLLIYILEFKFYWGFILFYIFFKSSGYKIDYRLFFILVCLVTAFDFFLMNSGIPFSYMKNIPGGEYNISAGEKLGNFHRCYGLGSGPTQSATIIVTLLASVYCYQRDMYRDVYMLISLVPLSMTGSGAGYVLFLIFVVYRYSLYRGIKLFVGLVLMGGVVILVTHLDELGGDNVGLLRNLTSSYIDFLIEFKKGQINEVNALLNGSIGELLFGYNYQHEANVRLMSDFGWLDMIEVYGYLGSLILILYFLLKRKISVVPIFIFLVGALHYPAFCSIPGQLLLGSYLAFNPQIYNDEK